MMSLYYQQLNFKYMIFDNCTLIKKLYNYLILILLKYITNKNLSISALHIYMYTYIYVYIYQR